MSLILRLSGPGIEIHSLKSEIEDPDRLAKLIARKHSSAPFRSRGHLVTCGLYGYISEVEDPDRLARLIVRKHSSAPFWFLARG